MATYTKLNHQGIQSLANNYDLKIIEFSSLDGGSGNSSYLLKDEKNSYVLTICDDKEHDAVFKMCQLLLLLESYNIPCNRLIKTVNGEILTTLSLPECVKPVILKEFIEGQVVDELNETMLYQVGMQIARLNKILAPDYLLNNHRYGRQIFSKALGLGIDNEYESWLSEEIVYLENHILPKLPCGLIHGDLFYDNLIFTPLLDMPISFKAIIDFEEACNYYLVFELGMAIVGCCTEDITINLKKARAFVDGYQQVRKLEEIEKVSLQLFVRYAAVATSYWRFNKYNIEEPSKDMVGHHCQMVQLSKEVVKISTTRFFDALFNLDS
jgi:homoserine kinase type II|tara:strand:+ start:429 stop:1403 length:975 start_codon:yes stop_codon:yes gene_type:complete